MNTANLKTKAESVSATNLQTITFLNMSGDITLTWDSTNEAAILALVERKMKEGYTFFITKPRFFGKIGTRNVPVTDIAQARAAGSITAPDALARQIVLNLGDADVNAIVEQGSASIVSSVKQATVETIGRARDAVEVIGQQSLAVRPIVGG